MAAIDDIDEQFGEEEEHELGGEKQIGKVSNTEKAAVERAALLEALSLGRTDRAIERVAWIMSRQPDTRDSDIALQFAYWKEYHPELYAAFLEDRRAMYQLPKLTSLARARARIQNTHRLFVASDAVRRRRRVMSEEERERFMNPIPPDPLLMVYADESGKTQSHLVVGTVWLLDPGEAVVVQNRIEKWRDAHDFQEELHFNQLSKRTLPLYQEVVKLVLGSTAGISFKSVSVTKEGIDDVQGAIDDLLVYLLLEGIAHEHASGRAPLPRRIQVWNDRDSEGRDALLATRIHEALTTASQARFASGLKVETVEAVDSKGQPLIQLADLYTASINRVLARGTARNQKDDFADFFLDAVRPRESRTGRVRDVEVHIRL